MILRGYANRLLDRSLSPLSKGGWGDSDLKQRHQLSTGWPLA